MTQTRDITIQQGATWSWGFTWHQPAYSPDGDLLVDAQGNPVPGEVRPLAGCTARMQVRKRLRSAPAIDATTENGLITIDEEQGQISFLFPADVTDAVTFTEGLYDIEVVFPTEFEGGTVRAYEGAVVGKPNVTRAAAVVEPQP